MKFTIELDNFSVQIEATPLPHFVPPTRNWESDPEDLEDIEQGNAGYYQLIYTCTFANNETTSHIEDGIVFSFDEDEMLNELEFHLSENKIIEQLENYQKLLSLPTGPYWAKIKKV